MLVTLGRFLDVFEAYIVCGRLRAEDIPATVAGDQHMIADWPLSLALGGARVQVPAAFADAAAALLAQYHAGELQDLDEAESRMRTDTCPAGGSHRLLPLISFQQRVLLMFTSVVASAPFPTRVSGYRCRRCGHRAGCGDG